MGQFQISLRKVKQNREFRNVKLPSTGKAYMLWGEDRDSARVDRESDEGDSQTGTEAETVGREADGWYRGAAEVVPETNGAAMQSEWIHGDVEDPVVHSAPSKEEGPESEEAAAKEAKAMRRIAKEIRREAYMKVQAAVLRNKAIKTAARILRKKTAKEAAVAAAKGGNEQGAVPLSTKAAKLKAPKVSATVPDSALHQHLESVASARREQAAKVAALAAELDKVSAEVLRRQKAKKADKVLVSPAASSTAGIEDDDAVECTKEYR